MYLCSSNKSLHIEENGIYISKSGINNAIGNVAIIENTNTKEQLDVINKYFNCNGLILSKDNNKNSIDSWQTSRNIKYLGKSVLLKKEEKNYAVGIKEYENVVVERVKNRKQFQDFFAIFTKVKKLKEEESVLMFSKKMFSDNYFLYVAYYNNQPAGIWAMIKTDYSLMIVDILVLEEFRQLNVLKSMASVAYNDAIKNGIYNYFALATSQFSLNVAKDYGYLADEYIHLWSINNNKVVI